MDRVTLTVIAVRLARDAAGRTVRSVRPVADEGLQIAFDGVDRDVRLVIAPGTGTVLRPLDAPPRVRGGRGAWPDVAGAADARLAGRALLDVIAGERPLTLRLVFEGGSSITLWMLSGGALLDLRIEGEPPRTLPRRTAPPASLEPRWIDPADAAAHADSPGARALLSGADAAVTVRGPAAAFDDRPRAKDGVRLRLLLDPAPLDEGEHEVSLAFDGALDFWWQRWSAATRIDARRAALLRLVKRAVERARRARAAVASEETNAVAPDSYRRAADALLSAGPRARLAGGVFHVPDPYGGTNELEIAADPPGAKPHEVAERLYARARRAERGQLARARRTAELEEQLLALELLLERAGRLETDDELAAAERDARDAGLPAGPDLAPSGSRTAAPARGEESGPARTYRSPGGFEVLAGRSAMQNDRLTFSVAGPEDLWFHARGRPGAHVVLRTGGRRDVPEADVRFAARIAAAFSRAPEGEAVDVIVARQKHVRKPRGAPPGSVTVQKETVLRVRVEPAPNS